MSSAFREAQKEDKKLLLQETMPFGILLSVIGGFLDAYTYISRHGVFANAQTGNIMLLGIHASSGEWKKALIYLPPILAFVLGVILVEMIKKSSSHFIRFEWEQVILILETLILFILGFLPQTFPDIVVTVTISFVASVQVCSFSRLVDSPYATTMMTGNLRKFSEAVYHTVVRKDPKQTVLVIRFLTIILSFLLGAVIGGKLTLMIGVKAIWGVALILIGPIVLISVVKRKSIYNLK